MTMAKPDAATAVIGRETPSRLPPLRWPPESITSVIDEFASLTTERNNYVHGLWFTNQDTGGVLRAEPSITHEMGPFTTAKPVSIKQPQHVLLRMEALVNAIVRIWGAVTAQQASPPPPSEQAG